MNISKEIYEGVHDLPEFVQVYQQITDLVIDSVETDKNTAIITKAAAKLVMAHPQSEQLDSAELEYLVRSLTAEIKSHAQVALLTSALLFEIDGSVATKQRVTERLQICFELAEQLAKANLPLAREHVNPGSSGKVH